MFLQKGVDFISRTRYHIEVASWRRRSSLKTEQRQTHQMWKGPTQVGTTINSKRSWRQPIKKTKASKNFRVNRDSWSFMRVWSWLRMNAGGVPNTCKSNAPRRELVPFNASGERVSNTWETYPSAGDNHRKRWLIPHSCSSRMTGMGKTASAVTEGWSRGALARRWGNGLPWLWCIADLRGWSATLGLRHGPNSYGRQQ